MSDYADELLRKMLEQHDLSLRPLGHDYDSVRKLRKQGNVLFEEVRAYLARPKVSESQMPRFEQPAEPAPEPAPVPEKKPRKKRVSAAHK